MKITLDIPDKTIAAFFDFVYGDNMFTGLKMQGHPIETDELYDGAEIKIEEGGQHEKDN